MIRGHARTCGPGRSRPAPPRSTGGPAHLRAALALAAGAAVSAAGCGAGHAEHPRRSVPHPVASSAAPAGTATPPPIPSATPTTHVLPAGCATVLSPAALDRLVGHHVGGKAQYIRGVPEPAIGRLDRVTCRYGVGRAAGGAPPASPPATATVVPVEVGLSTYSDDVSASQRTDFTVHEQEAKGARARQVSVLGKQAVLLAGGASEPMLVLADGPMTFALSMASSVATADRLEAVASAIGEAVLRNLG